MGGEDASERLTCRWRSSCKTGEQKGKTEKKKKGACSKKGVSSHGYGAVVVGREWQKVEMDVSDREPCQEEVNHQSLGGSL
jgi:hypothetical protein